MASNPVVFAVYYTGRPFAPHDAEGVRRHYVDAHRLGLVQNRVRQRVRAVRFQRSGVSEQFLFRMSIEGYDFLDSGSAVGKRACLIKRDALHLRGNFKVHAALYKHSGFGASGKARHYADRCGYHKGARARYHKYYKRLVKPIAPQAPKRKRRNNGDKERQNHHRGRVVTGEFFHPLLARSAGRLRFFHHPYDPGQRRILRLFRNSEFERAVAVDGSREHLISNRLVDGYGFAGDGGLVDGGRAFCYDPVQRDLLTRAYNNDRGDGNFIHRLFDYFPALRREDAGRRRSQVHKRFNGLACTLHAPRFKEKRKREKEGNGRRFEPFADGYGPDNGNGHEQVHVRPHFSRRV